MNQQVWEPTTEGRYPATLLHDGSDAVTAEFPVTAPSPTKTVQGKRSTANVLPNFTDCKREVPCAGDSGSASRYFTSAPYEPGELESLVPFLYCAKASTAERNAGLTNEAVPGGSLSDSADGGLNRGNKVPIVRNHHSTVKPIRLMEWLCNLLTPPGGLILDPFMGSGTTGIAAGRNGFDFIGCDLDPSYVALATERIAYWTHHRPEILIPSKSMELEPTNTPTLF